MGKLTTLPYGKKRQTLRGRRRWRRLRYALRFARWCYPQRSRFRACFHLYRDPSRWPDREGDPMIRPIRLMLAGALPVLPLLLFLL